MAPDTRVAVGRPVTSTQVILDRVYRKLDWVRGLPCSALLVVELLYLVDDNKRLVFVNEKQAAEFEGIVDTLIANIKARMANRA